MTSYLTGLDWPALQIKTKIVSCHAAVSKPVKQEVNDTVILPPLVFPGKTNKLYRYCREKLKLKVFTKVIKRAKQKAWVLVAEWYN